MRDPLTGLPGSGWLMQRLHRELRGESGVVISIDVDHLKLVNERHGYLIGDRILRGIALNLHRCCGERWPLARLGGDEFALIVPGVDDEAAQSAADELLHLIRGYTEVVGPRPVTATASMGAALFTADSGVTASEVMARASRALYRAKQGGRNSWVLDRGDRPDPTIDPTGEWSRSESIREVLDEGRIALHLQPVINLETGETTMHEVLMRVDIGGEPAAPGPYLEIAERFGLIHEIDRTVMRKSLDLLESHPGLNLSVNVSGKSLGDSQLLRIISDAIEADRFDPGRLVIELTETAAVVDEERAHQFAAKLGKMGCGFAIDDFGTGFGSYDYLKNVPVDYLKIDGAFVREWTRVDEVVIESLVGLAHGLGKKTIAEGVESAESLRHLGGLGVDLAQGFHIGRPQPAESVLADGS